MATTDAICHLPTGPSPARESRDAAGSFLEEVERIPGVLRVVTDDSCAGCPSIMVAVPSLRSEAAAHVFELQARVLREYPDAELDVRVKGLEERGISLADVHSAVL
jgi:hypothetical protein